MSTKVEKALELHGKGYNCAQAVACSFCEEFGVDQETMFKISEGFGFGMGMMDMCGAVTGMMMSLLIVFLRLRPYIFGQTSKNALQRFTVL